MAVKDPSNTTILGLVNSRANRSAWLVAPAGLQPAYFWLMATLLHLDAGTVADFLVKPDDASPTTIAVLPGRCTIGGNGVAYPGGTLDLAAYNNSTALIALVASSGAASISVGTSWPGGTHHKLAAVTLSAGQITAITDRRFESHFTV